MNKFKCVFNKSRNIFLLCFLAYCCFTSISSKAQTATPELQIDRTKTGLPFEAQWKATIIEDKDIQDNRITGKRLNLPFTLQSCISSQKEHITEITTKGFLQGPDNTKFPLEARITVNPDPDSIINRQ